MGIGLSNSWHTPVTEHCNPSLQEWPGSMVKRFHATQASPSSPKPTKATHPGAPKLPSEHSAKTGLAKYSSKQSSSMVKPKSAISSNAAATSASQADADACNPHPHATSAAQTAWAKRSLASSGSGSGSVRSQPRHPPPTARRYEDRGEGPAAHHGMIASAQRSSHARSSARLRISPRKASPKSRNRRRLAGPRRIAGQAGGASRYSPDSSSMCERSLLNSRR